MSNKNHVMIDEFPELRKLADRVGAAEVSRMFGLSSNAVGGMLHEGKCRPVYELTAKLINQRNNAGDSLIVVKCKGEQKHALLTLVNAMNMQHMDLDL